MPEITILRDTYGDYFLSYDGGATTCNLTLDHVPDPDVKALMFSDRWSYEHVVWQSGSES